MAKSKERNEHKEETAAAVDLTNSSYKKHLS